MLKARKINSENLIIRPATPNDLEDIREIYNHAVRTSIFTMDLEEKTIQDMINWLNSHTDRFPAYVAVLDSMIIGLATLSKWAERKGYYPSCEASIYLSPDPRAQGHGDNLLEYLIKSAKERDFSTIISFMTSTNKLAKNLVRRNNFTFIGTMKNVGYKFTSPIDLDIYQYNIKTPNSNL